MAEYSGHWESCTTSSISLEYIFCHFLPTKQSPMAGTFHIRHPHCIPQPILFATFILYFRSFAPGLLTRASHTPILRLQETVPK